ncbi:MAG: redoxin domain-containing protein [Cyanobacteriota bacterium]
MIKLKNNAQAPKFKKDNYLGEKINLKEYEGKKILLSFFRGASCAFCNLRINELIKKYPEFEKNKIYIIAFFAASKDEISKYAGNRTTPFPIIPDPNLEIYKKYAIEESYLGMFNMILKPLKVIDIMLKGLFNVKSITDNALIPADFLIDEKQNIYRSYYGKDLSDHLEIDDILCWRK